ncbi:BRO-N domain-containing protein [Streptomyces sp. LE64]|uniref:BRO-N domain-containing protein n=1 Tax=Streptomyces sp. LE64 TaxID=3448653 RepID=UPI004041D8B1
MTYTEESLLDSRAVRAALADRVHALTAVKPLPLLPDGRLTTAAMLADYFEVDAVLLRRVVRRHAEELADFDHRQLRGAELREFLAANLPERGVGARTIAVFTPRTALVLAMLLRSSAVARRVRSALLASLPGPAGHGRDGEPVPGLALTTVPFPLTDDPVRVVMVDGEPWFALADVCRVLGIKNPREARRKADPLDIRLLDLRVGTVTIDDGTFVSADQSVYSHDPHQLNLISETGLYTLVLRSRKPAAIPFQRWVTAELLPSIRRGDTDLGQQHTRMAGNLAEAVGRRLHVLADIEGPEAGITVLSDGTVHCRHGRMEWCVPEPAADSGPPYGPYFRCTAVERVGIGGSRALRPCGTVKFADVVRWSARTAREGEPEARDRAADAPPEQPAGAGLLLTVGDLRVQGSPEQIARVLRELGVAPPRSR